MQTNMQQFQLSSIRKPLCVCVCCNQNFSPKPVGLESDRLLLRSIGQRFKNKSGRHTYTSKKCLTCMIAMNLQHPIIQIGGSSCFKWYDRVPRSWMNDAMSVFFHALPSAFRVKTSKCYVYFWWEEGMMHLQFPCKDEPSPHSLYSTVRSQASCLKTLTQAVTEMLPQ